LRRPSPRARTPGAPGGWCLSRGMRVVKTMTLMTTGEYVEPRGSYLTSVLY
jgi:hypothetical protein